MEKPLDKNKGRSSKLTCGLHSVDAVIALKQTAEYMTVKVLNGDETRHR